MHGKARMEVCSVHVDTHVHTCARVLAGPGGGCGSSPFLSLPQTRGGDTPQDTAPGRVAHGDAVGAGVYEPK